jgi:archaellum biogenesis ATPase FlaH
LSEATSDTGTTANVVLDSITTLTTHIEPFKVIEFLQDRGARIKEAGGVFIFTMGKGTIEPNIASRLEEAVDCVVELDEGTNRGKTIRKLRIKKMRARKTSDRWVQFEIDPEKGVVFST